MGLQPFYFVIRIRLCTVYKKIKKIIVISKAWGDRRAGRGPCNPIPKREHARQGHGSGGNCGRGKGEGEPHGKVRRGRGREREHRGANAGAGPGGKVAGTPANAGRGPGGNVLGGAGGGTGQTHASGLACLPDRSPRNCLVRQLPRFGGNCTAR